MTPSSEGGARDGRTLVLTRRLTLALLVAAVAWVLSRVTAAVVVIVVPVLVAVMLAGFLMPLQVLLNHRARLPRLAAAAVTVLVALAAIVGMTATAGAALVRGVGDLSLGTVEGLERLEQILRSRPLGLRTDHLEQATERAQSWVLANGDVLSSGLLGLGSTLGLVGTGVLLTLVTTFFFLADGDRLWAWLVERLPARWRRDVHEASRRGWVTVGTYARVQVIVSAADAVGIGLGAWALGVPLVAPLTLLTFLVCFVPFAGAIASGALAVLLALATQGPQAALAMLVVVIVVQQLESNVLAPFLMGRAVSLHPLVVILTVTTAGYVAGLLGALLAVPTLAVVATMARYLSGDDMFPGLADGGSALTGSARRLAAGREPYPTPRRLGDAVPAFGDDER